MHVLGTAERAGASIASMVSILAQELDRRDFRLAACFLGKSGPWLAALNASGIDAFHVPWHSPLDLRGAYRFYRFLSSHRVDLLHVHYGGRSVRRVGRAATSAQVLVHAHGRVRSESDIAPVTLDLSDADAVIATSRAVAGQILARRVVVVYPGVPLIRSVARREPLLIGAAGRLVPIKGYDRLLTAFSILMTRHSGARLEIAGDGPSRADLERQAIALGLGSAVKFLGWSSDLPGLMARWSLFVQPSLEEALGITVLEAMASGLPVVASAVGGLPEIVQPGVTGALVAPGDVEALANALSELLQAPDRCIQFSDQAVRRAGHFSVSRFAAEVEVVYRDQLELPRDMATS